MSKYIARAEVAQHKDLDDIWIIIDCGVYDLTDFVDAHPGGSVALKEVAGNDATEAFYSLHRHEILKRYAGLRIGMVPDETPAIVVPGPGELSSVPYAEPLWLSKKFNSPYYNDSHRRYQRALRKFVEEEMTPEALQKEQSREYISQELTDKMADNNILACRLGPGKHLHNRKILGGVVDGREFDCFHDLITCQEMARILQRGFQDGNFSGMSISLSAVNSWAKKELKDKILSEVLSGKKKIALAVTEAYAGSDVAGIRTTAELNGDGTHYIVNGTKKWITNACKTKAGYTVLVVPKDSTVTCRAIKTAYSSTAGTTFVEFNNTKVPRGYLLGQEDKGFEVIMSNFNHERWMMACMVTQTGRTVVEESLEWAHQRHVFGAPLIKQPVVRSKLARMISLTEANQAWTEQITRQMKELSYHDQAKYLAGPIALLKTFTTRGAHEIANDAVHIFGGRGLTQTGMGRVVEMFSRTYKYDAILGGSEAVLEDLAVRQATKLMPRAVL
ncbi:probable acyl-CoA dehydrogenase family protein [Ramularia collo-cygni]|uniref:Probable acyl-CoA dehydrogenase family protein n=1 Tax=Ramularia collo-cygni TaxID=112498 RepID=A0A2D3V0S9_9PEZI|nr:probable acyl-CoA dehydrogenase family protein [Ramularia collo-cygni]CZT20325.1 probable acyl-CoA dehydrogenase family protein [Ramularia collo-cygni]